MAYCRVPHKQWKFSLLHQGCQQQCVFSSDRNCVKRTGLNGLMGPPDRESGGVQKSNPAISLECLFLDGDQSQYFGSAEQGGRVACEMQLEAVVLGGCNDGLSELRETVSFKASIRICKNQNLALGLQNASISG